MYKTMVCFWNYIWIMFEAVESVRDSVGSSEGADGVCPGSLDSGLDL